MARADAKESSVPTTAPSLSSLPVELLLEISSFLRERRDWVTPEPWGRILTKATGDEEESPWVRDRRVGLSDLAALCRTCRRLQAVVQPLLHASVSVATGYERDDKPCMRFSRVVHTLTSRPALGQSTTHVDAPCPAASLNRIRLLSQLLEAVPNLATAHFSLPRAETSRTWAVTTATQTLRLPASLHTLRLSNPDGEGQLDLTAAEWPALRVLDLRGCSLVVRAVLPAVLPRPALLRNLTTLRFTQMKMDLPSFENLVEAVGPGLAHVSIRAPAIEEDELGDEMDFILSNNLMTALPLSGVLQALLPWAQTLRSFDYTVDEHLPPSFGWPILAALPSFVVLESLWVESVYFPFYEDASVLATMLPPNLAALRLSGFVDHAPALRQLQAAIAEGKFPRLKHLVLDEQGFGSSYQLDPVLGAVLDMLRAVGVHVSVLPVRP